MSTRSIVTTTAAAMLLTGAAAAVAAPAQAFPAGWWTEKTFVCTATDRNTGAALPEVTVQAADQVGAAYYALPQFGQNADTLNVQCYEQA
ncbi:hypothetical protein NN3_01860 [Nocardia neocaledoniensis NBRC 108232]|uniref:Uncharacterized protein n=1 Tax=Nocardia neocaledoniensis TaxID=236511 RepID=A0A317N8P6_9NOCA|nr:hypothetical protein [Nocardia neocaledoniensis]PWV71635.1 hypothetical protein DFR69_110119 [Nocardia neocaledoniensis]GEM29179.1 hypothetical protein NN3_01860 [Nocardia neocaledoniensis NBRC 108232]